MKLYSFRNQNGIIHLLPVLVLALLVTGIFIAAKKLSENKDLRSRAQMMSNLPIVNGHPQSTGGCFRITNPAFCDTFDVPSPGGRAGDLDERRWAFSRVSQFSLGNLNSGTGTYEFINVFGKADLQRCLQVIRNIMPDNDSFFCGEEFDESNHWMEGFSDNGNWDFNDGMPRQIFDFTGRTGTIALEIDGQAQMPFGHGFWWDVWVTDEPSPAPDQGGPGSAAVPKNGIMIEFQACDSASERDGSRAKVHRISVIRNYQGSDASQFSNCFNTAGDKFNDIQIRLSQNKVEVWASDASQDFGLTFPNFRKITEATITMPFTKGFVHFRHAQYNTGKGNADCGGCILSLGQAHTFHWDNLGFDGNILPLRSYDVPDSLIPVSSLPFEQGPGMSTGYAIKPSGQICCTPSNQLFPEFSLPNIDLTGATRATLNFHAFLFDFGKTIQYRFNNGTWRTLTPTRNEFNWQTLSFPVLLSDLRQGTNTLEMKSSPVDLAVANIDLSLEVAPGPTPTPCVGAGCPTPTPTSTPTPSPVPPTSTPTPTPVPPGSLTVNFNDRTGTDAVFSGQYPSGVLDWGSASWWLAPAVGQFPDNSVSFTSALTQASIGVLQSRRLVSVDAFNGGSVASTVSITCSGNSSKTQSVSANTRVTLTTLFATACSTVTTSSTNGWDTNFDNFVLSAVGGTVSPTPSNTPTPTPTPTVPPTPVPTPTRTPSPVPTPTPCVKLGDMDGDCDIDITDLSIFLNRYEAKHTSADLNQDGQVTIADLSVFLSRFGT